MIIYLNSHDFPNAFYTRHLRADGTLASEVRIIRAQPAWTVDDIVYNVIHSEPLAAPRTPTFTTTRPARRPAIPERSIFRLIINSHGYIGRIGIGRGVCVENVRQLAPLRRYFTPLSDGGHGVLVDACLVASNSAYREPDSRIRGIGMCEPVRSRPDVCEQVGGYGFMMEMAQVLQTKITAGIELQISPGGGGADPGSLDGTYIRVFPNGTSQMVVQSY